MNFIEEDKTNWEPKRSAFDFPEGDFGLKKEISQKYKMPKTTLIKIILILIILVLSGTVTALYTKIWDPLWNPFRPEPDEVLSEVIENMEKVNTLSSTSDFLLQIKNEQEFSLSGKGYQDLDATNIENPRSKQNFTFKMAFEGMEFSLAGESITIGETYYFKLKTIPAFPFFVSFFEMAGIDLGEIKDQWIRTDEETTEKLQEEFGLPSVNSSETKELEKKKEEASSEIKEMIKGKKLIYIKEELADEKIGDKMTYHYLVALDKEEIRKLIPKVFDIFWEAYSSEPTFPAKPYQQTSAELAIAMTLPEEEISDRFLEAFDEFFEKVGEITFEVWIGKKDYLLYKVKGEKEIDFSKFREGAEEKIIIKAEVNLSDFNQPMEIEEPKEYKSLDEIFKPFFEEISLEEEKIEIQEEQERETVVLEVQKVVRREEIYPYDADVPYCINHKGVKYPTTGPDSAKWFLWGGCARYKSYNVVPGEELILHTVTDSCPGCVCYFPNFSIFEYKSEGWEKIKYFDLPDLKGSTKDVYYTPQSNRIKIEADGCFYLAVFHYPEEERRKLTEVEKTVNEFMEARMEQDWSRALTYLTENAREQFLGLKSDLILVNENFANFKILRIERRDKAKFRAIVKISGKTQIYDLVEAITIKEILGGYFIDSVELAG